MTDSNPRNHLARRPKPSGWRGFHARKGLHLPLHTWPSSFQTPGSRAPLALGDNQRTRMGWEPVLGTTFALLPAQSRRCNQNTLAFQERLILTQLMLTRDPSGETEPFEPPTLTSTGHSGFKGQTTSKRTAPVPMLWPRKSSSHVKTLHKDLGRSMFEGQFVPGTQRLTDAKLCCF